jgi:hypothetical protein
VSIESNAKLLGVAILVGGFFVAFGVSESVGTITPKYDRTIGFAVGGFAMGIVDLALRRVWGTGSGAERYLAPSAGPSVSLAPCWLVGILFVMLGLALAVR